MRSPTALVLSSTVIGFAGVVNPQANPNEGARMLPPLPAGVAELSWKEFFVAPVGREGLQLTPKVKSLDGKRVRLLGYMVRREEPLPGVLILTPFPASVEEHESGFADLPPQAVRVLLPYAAAEQIPYTPRPLLLTGILSVGRREESREASGGAVSWFRLTLDKPGTVSADSTVEQKSGSKPNR